MEPDPTAIALLVASTLERLGIRYVLAGSMASTLYGEPRTTLDVDFAIQLEPDRAEDLFRALERDFFVDRASVHEAATHKGHLNAIHRTSLVKVDLYARPATGIHASEIDRAHRVALRAGGDAAAQVASPEDTILQKLRWYAMSDGVSDRQWRDVLGILKAQAGALDREYLERWSRSLGLEDLLARARREAGEPE